MNIMKITQLVIFITIAAVLYSMSSSGSVDALQSGNRCRTNDDCHSSEYCINFNCINACGVRNCSETKVCQVQNHRASCLCATGYKEARKLRKCVKEEITRERCSNNGNCNSREICKNEICVDACADRKCRKYEACVSKNHQSSCQCISGFVRNTTSNDCQREECETNMECPGHQECQKNDDGVHSCRCMANHARSEEGECEHKCIINFDCLENETCDQNICKCIDGSLFHYSWYDQIKKCLKGHIKSVLDMIAKTTITRT